MTSLYNYRSRDIERESRTKEFKNFGKRYDANPEEVEEYKRELKKQTKILAKGEETERELQQNANQRAVQRGYKQRQKRLEKRKEYEFEVKSWVQDKPFSWQKPYLQREKEQNLITKSQIYQEEEKLSSLDKKWERTELSREEKRLARREKIEKEAREQEQKLEALQNWKKERNEKLEKFRQDVSEKYLSKTEKFNQQMEQELEELRNRAKYKNLSRDDTEYPTATRVQEHVEYHEADVKKEQVDPLDQEIEYINQEHMVPMDQGHVEPCGKEHGSALSEYNALDGELIKEDELQEDHHPVYQQELKAQEHVEREIVLEQGLVEPAQVHVHQEHVEPPHEPVLEQELVEPAQVHVHQEHVEPPHEPVLEQELVEPSQVHVHQEHVEPAHEPVLEQAHVQPVHVEQEFVEPAHELVLEQAHVQPVHVEQELAEPALEPLVEKAEEVRPSILFSPSTTTHEISAVEPQNTLQDELLPLPSSSSSQEPSSPTLEPHLSPIEEYNHNTILSDITSPEHSSVKLSDDDLQVSVVVSEKEEKETTTTTTTQLDQ